MAVHGARQARSGTLRFYPLTLRGLKRSEPAASCIAAGRGKIEVERGRNGFDGIELVWKGVPGSELPLNDRKTKTANTQFAYAA